MKIHFWKGVYDRYFGCVIEGPHLPYEETELVLDNRSTGRCEAKPSINTSCSGSSFSPKKLEMFVQLSYCKVRCKGMNLQYLKQMSRFQNLEQY